MTDSSYERLISDIFPAIKKESDEKWLHIMLCLKWIVHGGFGFSAILTNINCF